MQNDTQLSAEPNHGLASKTIETDVASTSSSQSTIQIPPTGVDDDVLNFNPGMWLYMAIATLAVLTWVVALDATSLAVALPVSSASCPTAHLNVLNSYSKIMSKVLHGTGLEAFWAGTSFLLCSTVFQPPLGALSSIFGRKTVLTVSVVFFLAGCLICGLAHNFTTILVGRSIQGIGGGGILVLTEIIICDLIPLRLRGQWFGALSGMYAIGTVLGPIVGGAFAQHVTWVSLAAPHIFSFTDPSKRWIFWINLPFIGIGLVMTPIFIKLQVLPTSLAQKLARVDWIGSIIFIGSATGLILAISWGGVQYPWSSFHTLVPLILGIAGLVGFYFYEEMVATDPIVHTIVFKNRNAAAAYIDTVLHSMIVLALVYYLPLYYEGIKGFSTTLTGAAVLPETLTVAPAAVIAGTVITKIGVFRWAVWSGWAIATLGLGILYLMDVNTTTVQWVFLNLVAGIGTGLLYPALQFSVQSATSNEHMAEAVAMYSFFRGVGQALGVAIGGTVFQNQLYVKLMKKPNLAATASQYSQDAAALAQIIRTMPEGQDRTDLIQQYADALKIVWVVMCALAGVGLLVGFAIRNLPLDRLLYSPQHPELKKSETDMEKNVGPVNSS